MHSKTVGDFRSEYAQTRIPCTYAAVAPPRKFGYM